MTSPRNRFSLGITEPSKALASTLNGVNVLLNCAIIGIGGYVFFSGFVNNEFDELVFSSAFGCFLILVGVLRIRRVFRPSIPQPVVAATPGERRSYRALGVLLAVAFMVLGMLLIRWAHNEPFQVLFGCDLMLIGLIVAIAVRESRHRAMIERDGTHVLEMMALGRYVYWAAGGFLLVMAAGMIVQFWPLAPVFAGIAIGFIVAAVRSSMRLRRFGQSMLVLSEAPLRRGTPLRGVVQTTRGSLGGGGGPAYSAELVAYRTIYTNHGDGRSTSVRGKKVWSRQADVALSGVQSRAEGIAIPINIEIATDAPPSSVLDNETCHWELEVRRYLPGLSYHAVFQLYVA